MVSLTPEPQELFARAETFEILGYWNGARGSLEGQPAPVFGIVRRDAVQLFLSLAEGGDARPPRAEGGCEVLSWSSPKTRAGAPPRVRRIPLRSANATAWNAPGYCMAMPRYRATLMVPMLVFVAGCDALGIGDVCTLELTPRYSPADTTIQIGQSFQASVQLLSCGGKKHLADVFTWHAEDPTIARVDEQTGRVVGEGSGTTRVSATGQRYGSVGGIHVGVQGLDP